MSRVEDDRGEVKIVTPVSRRGAAPGWLLWRLTLVAVLLGSCSPKDTSQANRPEAGSLPKTASAPISNTDECAERLHDIIGGLYEYYLGNHRLPARLEDLRQLRGFEKLELTCPVSKLPYVYNPVGIITPDNQPRIICYDAAPSHYGPPHVEMRWAISIIEPRELNGPLVAKVVAVPESAFTLKLPR